MSEPSDKLSIRLTGNVYETNYPTIGQLIRIKNRELYLSEGYLEKLLYSDMAEEIDMLIAIKAIAHIEVLFPKILTDLKVGSLLDVRYDDFLSVQKVYGTEILPWLKEWRDKVREAIYGSNGD